MISFNFGGKDSYNDYGIIISKRPSFPSPKKRVSYINIPGRDSSLRYDEGTFEDITIAVECTIKDKDNIIQKIDDIKAWLFGAGESDLIFSFQEGKKYIAQVVNSIDFKQVYKRFGQFVIIFNCRPYKYDFDNSPIFITEKPYLIINNGTVDSEPIFTVYGTGDITITVEDYIIKLLGINDFIVIDSQIMECHKGTELKNNSMIGDFPLLKVGENTITWEGNVTKIQLVPNFRFL